MSNPPSQFALAHFRSRVQGRATEWQPIIAHIQKMSAISDVALQGLVDALKERAQVALHFHPDRLVARDRTVVESMNDSLVYLSQFETGISNGLVDNKEGGERDQWENLLFGGAYHQSSFNPKERPKYGALDLCPFGDGPSPRFGSCYFLLKPELSKLATFCFGDSHENPEEKGTIDQFEDILAETLVEAFTRDFARGLSGVNPRRWVEMVTQHLRNPTEERATLPLGHNLDHYIEAQVHQEIALDKDIACLVADPSFKGTSVGKDLENLANKCTFPIHWHAGFEIGVGEVPHDFRGETMPSLAQRLGSPITAAKIGSAAQDVVRNPEHWKDRGTVKSVTQELKLLWHTLVKFG